MTTHPQLEEIFFLQPQAIFSQRSDSKISNPNETFVLNPKELYLERSRPF